MKFLSSKLPGSSKKKDSQALSQDSYGSGFLKIFSFANYRPLSFFKRNYSKLSYFSQQGFTLIELVVYIGIFVIVIGIFTGLFTDIFRVNNEEVSSNELTSQLNFAMQNINKLVGSSSNIESPSSTPSSYLKLRMADPSADPTCIYLSNGKIELAQGPDSFNKQNCTSTVSDLTSSQVSVDNLLFSKMTFYPGHDEVSVDIQMSYNTQNSQSKLSRAIHSSVSRASAATFDDNLIPGSNSYSIGTAGSQWNNINGILFFSGNNLEIGSNPPSSSLTGVQIANGDLYLSNPGSGIILKTPGGMCEKLAINDLGSLTTTTITCP